MNIFEAVTTTPMFDTQIDTFLRAHEVWMDYTIEDLERERAGLQRLGF